MNNGKLAPIRIKLLIFFVLNVVAKNISLIGRMANLWWTEIHQSLVGNPWPSASSWKTFPHTAWVELDLAATTLVRDSGGHYVLARTKASRSQQLHSTLCTFLKFQVWVMKLLLCIFIKSLHDNTEHCRVSETTRRPIF